MIINEHTLIHASDAGNGYHGNCQHCGVPLVTDLGYSSWAGLKCVDRKIELYQNLPKEVRDYANFHGYRFDNVKKVFNKASFSKDLDQLTIDQMHNRMIGAQIADVMDEKSKIIR